MILSAACHHYIMFLFNFIYAPHTPILSSFHPPSILLTPSILLQSYFHSATSFHQSATSFSSSSTLLPPELLFKTFSFLVHLKKINTTATVQSLIVRTKFVLSGVVCYLSAEAAGYVRVGADLCQTFKWN